MAETIEQAPVPLSDFSEFLSYVVKTAESRHYESPLEALVKVVEDFDDEQLIRFAMLVDEISHDDSENHHPSPLLPVDSTLEMRNGRIYGVVADRSHLLHYLARVLPDEIRDRYLEQLNRERWSAFEKWDLVDDSIGQPLNYNQPTQIQPMPLHEFIRRMSDTFWSNKSYKEIEAAAPEVAASVSDEELLPLALLVEKEFYICIDGDEDIRAAVLYAHRWDLLEVAYVNELGQIVAPVADRRQLESHLESHLHYWNSWSDYSIRGKLLDELLEACYDLADVDEAFSRLQEELLAEESSRQPRWPTTRIAS